MTEFEANSIELDSLKNQINNLSFYPICESGVLCPLLDDEDLLYSFYDFPNYRKSIKQFCKKNKWIGKPPVPVSMNVESLKKLIHSMCNSAEVRQKLVSKEIPLHMVIWHWASIEHKDIYNKVLSACHERNDRRKYLKIADFKRVLDEEKGNPENRDVFIYLALAFAMLQKKEAVDFILIIVEEYPDIIYKLIGSDVKDNELNELNELNESISVTSLYDLIRYKNAIDTNIKKLTHHSQSFEDNIRRISKVFSINDFGDNENIQVILSDIEVFRQKIKNTYNEIISILTLNCTANHDDICSLPVYSDETSSNTSCSVESVIRKLSLFQSKLQDYVEEVQESKNKIETLKKNEIDLQSRGAEKGRLNFKLPSNDAAPCEYINSARDYQCYITKLKNDLRINVKKQSETLVIECDEIVNLLSTNYHLNNVDYLVEVENIKNSLMSADSQSEINSARNKIDQLMYEVSSQSTRGSLSLAKKLNDNIDVDVDVDVDVDELLDFCNVLITENKSEVALLLLFSYQYIYQSNTDVIDLDKALNILIEVTCNSVEAGIPIFPTYTKLFSLPWLSNITNENLTSTDLRERIMIMLIAMAITYPSESSANMLSKLNAVEFSRINSPKLLHEIVKAVVGRRKLKIVSQDVLNNMHQQVNEIEERVAFEDGKFRHIQRNSKYFSRFEATTVFPALTDLWDEVSFYIKKEELGKAKSKISEINISEWYQKLQSDYGKSLIDHHHFSLVTQKTIEDFIFKINNHLVYLEEQKADDSFLIIQQDLSRELDKWSSSDLSRKVLVDQIERLLLTELGQAPEENLWNGIYCNQNFIVNNPQTIIWLQAQRTPKTNRDLMRVLLNDASRSYELEEVKKLLLDASAWKPLSLFPHVINKSESKKYDKSHLDALSLLNERRELVDLIGETQLQEIYENCINGHRLSAAGMILKECEKILQEKSQLERTCRLNKITGLLGVINTIKDIASDSNMPEQWQESIWNYASKIEMKLRGIRRSDDLATVIDSQVNKLEEAIKSLKKIAESNSQDFDEVEYYLSTLNVPIEKDANINLETALVNCPDLITEWKLLASTDLENQGAVEKTWVRLIKAFLKALNLYHDENDPKKRFGKAHSVSLRYAYPIYQSAFYKPQSEFLKRPIRLYIYRNDVDVSTLKRLEKELLTEDSVARLHIVFAPQGANTLKKYFKYDNDFKNFLLIDEGFLTQICCADKHEVPLRQALHASMSELANSSPFVAQGYCHEENNIYVGRKDILKKLLNTPQAMIWGGRRIGKTSVLHALRKALSRRGYKVAYVYVDIPDDGDPDLAIAKKIAVTLDLGHVESITEFEFKVSELRKDGVKIAFLIDEVDEYIKKSRSANKNFPLATVLRQLVMDDSNKNTFLVYSGYHQLYYEAKLDKEKRRVGHPFRNIAQEIPIRDLTYDDVSELVKTGFEEMLGIKVHPKVPRLIADRASRHPAFIQQFCRCLLDHISQRRSPSSSVTVSPEDVETVYAATTNKNGGEQAFILYVNETLGYNLSHLGRAIVLTLTDLIEESSNEQQLYSVNQISTHLCVWCDAIGIDNPSVDHFNQTIELLIMTNMLTQDEHIHDNYKVTYPTYIDILKRLDKIGKSAIELSLLEYDSKERTKGVLL